MSTPTVVPAFAALGDPTRLRIVDRLCAGGPMSIARLADGAGVSRQAITKHLDRLAGAGIVRGERRGRERVWALDARRIGEARAYLDRIAAGWDERIERLRALVEEPG